MPRPSLIRTKSQPYHVSSRTLFGEPFPLPLAEVWMIMLTELKKLQHDHELAIHAFVLMNNHFHLLCHTPHENLDQVMQNFLRRTSLRMQKKSETKPLWQGRYKWSLISAMSHYYQVYRYIHQNPIRAKIVERVQDWPFTSLHEVPFPLHTHVPMSLGGHEGELLWLNDVLNEEDRRLVQLGLRKFQFDVNRRKMKVFERMRLPE